MQPRFPATNLSRSNTSETENKGEGETMDLPYEGEIKPSFENITSLSSLLVKEKEQCATGEVSQETAMFEKKDEGIRIGSDVPEAPPETPSGQITTSVEQFNGLNGKLNKEPVNESGLDDHKLDNEVIFRKRGQEDLDSSQSQNNREENNVAEEEEEDIVSEDTGKPVLSDDFGSDEPKHRSRRSASTTTGQIYSTDDEIYQASYKKHGKHTKKKKKSRKSRREGEIETLNKNRMLLSGSSVESFCSDASKTLNAKEPMVTWEKLTIGRLLQKIWTDPIIQRVYELEEKSPQLEAPLGYIMDTMDRMSVFGYQPTNEDILNARKRTSGVNLLEFEAYGAKFLLIDVGGQRTERKKWLAHFDIVDAVIFVVGLDQYDQVMMEDGVTNRLRDSLELFDEMCSSPWFRNSSFLLFLNKSDIFKTKIKQIPLTVCFRNFPGDPHDYEQTTKFIIKRFQTIHNHHASNFRQEMSERRRGNAVPHVYPYLTCATDTEQMRFVIDACQDILLRNEMAHFGFFDF